MRISICLAGMFACLAFFFATDLAMGLVMTVLTVTYVVGYVIVVTLIDKYRQ